MLVSNGASVVLSNLLLAGSTRVYHLCLASAVHGVCLWCSGSWKPGSGAMLGSCKAGALFRSSRPGPELVLGWVCRGGLRSMRRPLPIAI